MTALIRVHNFGRRFGQGIFASFKYKTYVQSVINFPRNYVPRVPIDYRRQIQVTILLTLFLCMMAILWPSLLMILKSVMITRFLSGVLCGVSIILQILLGLILIKGLPLCRIAVFVSSSTTILVTYSALTVQVTTFTKNIGFLSILRVDFNGTNDL